jgi:alpha-mannosidase
MVHFPLAGRIDRLVHGTPYHWDRKRPERAGAPTFEATHQFVIPQFHGRARAAIFHAGVPAWAVQRDGIVIGALWRNANVEQCDFLGAEGSDPHEVALSYALRVPTGIRGPESGAPLREALAFSTALTAVVGNPSGDLPRVFSLARASRSEAIIMAAKAGTTDPDALVLRVYQPTNRSLGMAIRHGARRRFPARTQLVVEGLTALEGPLPPAKAAALELSNDVDRVGVVARRALTTVAIHAREK